jgi:hypothetical protein
MTTKTTTKSKQVFDFRTIKTKEDAFKKCGLDPATVPDVSKLPERFGFLTTVYILAVIFEAVNDGWIQDRSNPNQAKYYPWPWVSSSGLDFSFSGYDCDGAYAGVGFPLCTDTPEKAIYVLEQFPDLWKHWFLNVKPQ